MLIEAKGPDASERFRRIADSLPGLIWLAGTDKLCTWFNKTWLDFVGRRMEQELGNGWAENVHPDDFARCLEIYVTSFDARRAFRMEYRLRYHDGTYRWLLDEGIPLYDEGGEFTGYVGSCLDISEQKQIAEDLQRSLEREHRIATTLQSAFLPPFLPKVDGLGFQAAYLPAGHDAGVGGDWYDAFVLRDGRIALSIGDVFGHGLEAAGAMVRLRETLRAITGVIDDDPAAILQLADRAFQTSHPGVIASAIIAMYDPVTRRLTIANAGHPQPALVRDGNVTLLPPGQVLLGVSPASSFTVHETMLEAGDSFVLYTDGLVEVERDFAEGERRLLIALADGNINAEDLVTKLTGGKQQDDVAVLILSVLASAMHLSWRFQTDDARSAQHARDAFTAHLRQRKIAPGIVDQAVFAFGELVANVVRHAPGPIEIELYRETHDLVLYVRDRGPIFSADNPALPKDLMSEGGRGLFLVSEFTSKTEVAKRPGGGNEICVRLSLA